jgi:hypothetical protein
MMSGLTVSILRSHWNGLGTTWWPCPAFRPNLECFPRRDVPEILYLPMRTYQSRRWDAHQDTMRESQMVQQCADPFLDKRSMGDSIVAPTTIDRLPHYTPLY